MSSVNHSDLIPHFGPDEVDAIAARFKRLDGEDRAALEEYFALVDGAGVRLNPASPAFGSTEGLRDLADAFRAAGEILVIDGIEVRPQEEGGCVAVGGDSSYESSGCLISPDVVLTAGHVCASAARVSGESPVVGKSVGIKVNPPWKTPEPYEVLDKYEHDIGLLFLRYDVKDIEPARLLEVPLGPAVHTGYPIGYGVAETSGYGGYGTRRRTPHPLTIFHGALPSDPLFDDRTEFLADDKQSNADTCRGDSGGPFMVELDSGTHVAGITLRSATGVGGICGEGTIYLRIHPFVRWIDRMIKCHGGKPRPGAAQP